MKISAIVVEYHSIDEIGRAINSLRSIKDLEIEIIVSSNSGYGEKERKELEKRYEGVHWIFNDRNGGFGYGMNRGLRVASGDYMVIMNPDCKIKWGLGRMVAFMEEHPEIGAAGPRIQNRDGKVQDSAREYVTPWRFFKRQIQRIRTGQEIILEKGRDYSKVQTVDWVIGAFIIVSRKAYELAGGLNEDYFMYAEDMDWCIRIREQGMEIAYFPQETVEYVGTRSARKSKAFAKIFIKSHLKFWKKNGFFAWQYPKRRELEDLK